MSKIERQAMLSRGKASGSVSKTSLFQKESFNSQEDRPCSGRPLFVLPGVTETPAKWLCRRSKCMHTSFRIIDSRERHRASFISQSNAAPAAATSAFTQSQSQLSLPHWPPFFAFCSATHCSYLEARNEQLAGSSTSVTDFCHGEEKIIN